MQVLAAAGGYTAALPHCAQGGWRAGCGGVLPLCARSLHAQGIRLRAAGEFIRGMPPGSDLKGYGSISAQERAACATCTGV